MKVDSMEIIKLALLLLGLVASSKAGDYNYGQVIEKSLLFYEAQRTGRLPADNRISWRGDSFVTDRGTNNEDLSGGYFDGKLFVISKAQTIILKTSNFLSIEISRRLCESKYVIAKENFS